MRLALLALVVLALAACGDGGQDSGGPMSIEDALRADGQTVIVEGGIVAMDGGPVRLCYALMESYPPQCGEPALELRGLDLDALELETSAGDPSVSPARWSDGPVRIRGTVENGVLMVESVLS
jgi:type IV pilus biogenesis protein CpaD/CtpE